jgi:protein O-mannosyl-transferase
MYLNRRNKNNDFKAEQENNYFWAMAKKQIPKKVAPVVIKEVISVKAALIAIVAVTFIAFYPILSNGFVFWDDPQYILNNPLMFAPLKVMFFGGHASIYMWNYHPLTILVYSIEHKFFGVDMMGYHAVSLLLHITNSVLVFFFVYLLLNKRNILVAFITAILFGIHPMHVESVAWGSELKDVLYTFFFLAALVCYVLYMQKGKQMKYLGYAFVLYLLSLISKGQAVTLPLSFLLVDYFLGRKFDSKMIWDKILFFALSIIFGIIAIKAQDNSIVINNGSDAFHNFFLGFYGLSLYFLKFIAPIHLSGLYPYPNPAETGNSLPIIVKTAPLIMALLLGGIYWKFKSNKYVMFGVLFFLANIFTVLKFIPVSEAIMADRYSYIPYIGLFFVVGYGFNKLLNNPKYKPNAKAIQFGGVLILITLSSLTWARTMVWKDSLSFWGDAIEKSPTYWHPYEGVGEAYLDKGDYPSAIKYFKESIDKDISHQNSNHSSMLNLGLCYYRTKKYDSALKVYNDLIALVPDEKKAYYQRGLVEEYENPPQPELALADYSKAIDMDPGYVEAYLSRGSIYVDQLGKYDLGIADFSKALEMNPANMDAVVNIGVAYYKEGNFDEALNNYNQALGRVNDNGRIYFLEALAYAGKNDYTKALDNADQAQKAGSKIDAALLQQWKSKVGSK